MYPVTFLRSRTAVRWLAPLALALAAACRDGPLQVTQPDGSRLRPDPTPSASVASNDDSPTRKLTVDFAGNWGGSVTFNPIASAVPTATTFLFPTGTVLTLTATPTPNGVFAGWGGACAPFGRAP